MHEASWLSVLPPVLAVALAIRTKQVYLSLFLGIFLGWTILEGFNPLKGMAATLEAIVHVFQDPGNTRVILFCGLVGALMNLTRQSGGVGGFIRSISRRGLIKTKRSAQTAAAVTGLAVFVETSVSCLIVGSIFRPLFDKHSISREKLAYICDSTSAPVNLLIPLNAWGAFIIGLLAQENISDPLATMLAALPFNFYALFTIILVFIVIYSNKNLGPMKEAEQKSRSPESRDPGHHLADPLITSPVNMTIPLAIMIGMMPLGLLITGKGNIAAGSGSVAVYWAVMGAIVSAVILYSINKVLTIKESIEISIKGIAEMVPLMMLMMLAFAIGDVSRELQTGQYVAQLAFMAVPLALIPVILFAISCFIAFSTGTSWGTFAIMIPIAVPVALETGLYLPMTVAAVLGGGLFGDHCSPISDTTLIASMASGCTLIDHVRTQLPYAFITASMAAVYYILAGFVL
jgi:Na+/H+ antiporter NhaC